jgi:hypothetical protein
MGKSLKAALYRLRHGWYWAVALLLLPSCTWPTGYRENRVRGAMPRDAAVFCDIPKLQPRECATPEQEATGLRLEEAAVALNDGRTAGWALDYSEDARNRCPLRAPEVVVFEGGFPEGLPVCLNCTGVVGTPEVPNVTEVCRQQCYDFQGVTTGSGRIVPTVPPSAATVTFCNANAVPSTNFPRDRCYDGVCSPAGAPLSSFIDPRRTAEPAKWSDLIGTTAEGTDRNDVRRATTTTLEYDAGAVSDVTQWIEKGDGFVEFSTDRTDQARVIGFDNIPATCPAPCTDREPNFRGNLDAGLLLNFDGLIYIIENGSLVMGPDMNGSFGPYAANERFRIYVRDNANRTAQVSYLRLPAGGCTPGTRCGAVPIDPRTTVVAFPLRVDVSLREIDARLTNVLLVRVK